MEIGKEVSIKLQRVEATQGWDSGTDGAGETSRKVKGPTLIVTPAAILQQVRILCSACPDENAWKIGKGASFKL